MNNTGDKSDIIYVFIQTITRENHNFNLKLLYFIILIFIMILCGLFSHFMAHIDIFISDTLFQKLN